MRIVIAAWFVLLASLASAFAQDAPRALYIIYDSSNSMWGELPDKSRKYETARKVLADFLGQDFGDRPLAFRAYGHRRTNDCRDSELIAPFGPARAAAAKIAGAKNLRPTGMTPIDHSLREALKDFGGRSGDIILISDGIESCDADPCALAREWAGKDIGIRIHVVGLGLDEKARAAMKCIADASGTDYRDAQSAGELQTSLSEIRDRPADTVLRFDGSFAGGETVLVHADVVKPTGERVAQYASDKRLVTVAGAHTVSVGVRTANGTLYRPLSLSVDAPAGREVRVPATVPRPPRLRAEFSMQGIDHSGALIVAYRDGREVFRFRPQDAPYVEEGEYEFRVALGDQRVSLREKVGAGDDRTLRFALEQRVRVVVRAASSFGEDMRENFDLFRGGEQIASGHSANGVTAPPGLYEMRFRNDLTPFVVKDFEVPLKEAERAYTVPAGRLIVRYRTDSGELAKDTGYVISRLEGSTEKGRRVFSSATRTAFLPGRYRIESRLSKVKDVRDIEIENDKTIEIVFTAR